MYWLLLVLLGCVAVLPLFFAAHRRARRRSIWGGGAVGAGLAAAVQAQVAEELERAHRPVVAAGPSVRPLSEVAVQALDQPVGYISPADYSRRGFTHTIRPRRVPLPTRTLDCGGYAEAALGLFDECGEEHTVYQRLFLN